MGNNNSNIIQTSMGIPRSQLGSSRWVPKPSGVARWRMETPFVSWYPGDGSGVGARFQEEFLKLKKDMKVDQMIQPWVILGDVWRFGLCSNYPTWSKIWCWVIGFGLPGFGPTLARWRQGSNWSARSARSAAPCGFLLFQVKRNSSQNSYGGWVWFQNKTVHWPQVHFQGMQRLLSGHHGPGGKMMVEWGDGGMFL